MALVLADRVQDVTTTTGTGTLTLANTPPTGFQSFAVIGNGNTTYYAIYGGSNWEVGIGTYTSIGTTLTRDTVLASSNSGSLVNFGSGDKAVFVTYPAEKSVNEDAAGNVNINITGSAASATTATNLAAGAAGSVPYQTAANTTAFVATASGVLVGGTTPSFSTTPTLTGTNFTAIPNAALSNNSVTVGTTAISLGATSLTLAGLTSVTLTQDPVSNLQVATKQYVDTQTSAGIHYHQPVRVESPTNLSATYSNGSSGVGATLTNAGTQVALAIDGVTLSVGNRVLVYTQTTQTQNGIYVVTSVGSGSTNWVLTRSSDANTYVNASPTGLSEGSTVFVQEGTTGAGETYTCTTQGTITFGTTAIVFAQISSAQIYSAGTGLTLTGTQFSLTSPVATTLGGTGLTTFGAANRAIYSSGTTTLTAGTLPTAAGGTGHTSYTDGQILIGKSSDGTLEKATLTQGTGITVTNGSGAITVTNSAPDQTVSLTGGGTTTIGGSYPSFSISSADQYVGTVTSVSGTGTVNGLTLTGTVTSTGSLTLGGTLSVNLASATVTGTLPVANGGTGVTSSTGSVAVVLSNSPTLVTPVLGVASATSLTTTGQVTVPDQLAYDYATSNLPTTRPALSLDFVDVGALDPRVTFTRGSTATFTGSNGLIQTAAINAPRFDYDPVTLAPKGLLIEEQRVNLQTYSEQFDNAIWSGSSSLTIAANSTVSPDGTSTADTGTRTTTSTAENMRRAVTTQAINTTYTLTVYVKANTAGARLYMRNLAVDNTITTGVVQFNPADGTISTTYGSVYVGKATMTAAGNGWYRCSITGTTTAVIATNFIDIGVTDGTSAVGGNAANSVFLWGAQLEAGSFATSYIPTVASQVTRSADVATMTGTNFSSWYNQSEGTLLCEFDTTTLNVSGTTSYAATGISDGTSNNSNFLYTYSNFAGGQVRTGNVVQADINGGGSPANNTAIKSAIAYATNNVAVTANGAVPGTDTSATINTTMSQLGIGNRALGNPINGHIRSITYYNTRLPNAVLQGITS